MSDKKPKLSGMLQEADIETIMKIMQNSVQTLKDSLGEDKFCNGVGIALEMKFENPLVPDKIITQYMTLGDERQYKNLACYLAYSVGMMNAKSPDDIENALSKVCDELKELVLQYNKDNPYTDEQN